MKLSVPSSSGKGKSLLQSLSVVNKAVLDTGTANNMWTTLQDAIHKIFQQNSSSLSYEQLYGYAYKLCLHKKGEMLYNGVSETVRRHLLVEVEHVSQVPSEVLLSAVKQLWDEFKTTVINIKDVLMYMDRNFVKQTRRADTRELCFAIFRDMILFDVNIRSRFQRLLLEHIASERNGLQIDRSLMKSTLYMLVELGVYDDEFEKDFLQQTKEFYMRESQEFLSQYSCPDFMRKAEIRILEECDRSTNYLSASTSSKLLTIVEAQLITSHARALVTDQTGCSAMFQENQIENLQRMYTLFHRVPGTLDILRDFMATYVKEAGLGIVKDPDNSKNPVRFVQQMLDLRAKFDVFIEKSFSAERKSQRVLKTSFEDFINIDVRCANHLAAYCDDMLKNAAKEMTETEIDVLMNRFIVIFCYFTDKDVFENSYKNLLAKRLLNGKSTDDMEKMMITKLKTECGYQFTSKLEGMFTDIQLSKGVMQDFRSSDYHVSLPSNVDMEVQVLTAGYWPIKLLPLCKMPVEIDQCREVFQEFYLNKYQGRKIVWSSQNGTADLKANYQTGRKDLIVSTFQMCILMMFNTQTTLSLAHIFNTLGVVDETEIKRHLLSLCTSKMKILVKASKGKGILPDDTFTFNAEFTSKSKRLKVQLISLKEITGDDTDSTDANGNPKIDSASAIPSNVEEDRKGSLEACIVRIMKTRRTIMHNDLVAEVTRQLQGRFNPKPVFIKKRVESLIERDYIDRDKQDPRKYTYLA